MTVVEESSASNSPSTNGVAEVSAPEQNQDTPTPLFATEEVVQPFTAFIEEFRQKEERLVPQDAQPMDAQVADALNHAPTVDHNEQTESVPTQEAPASTPANTDAETTEASATNSVPTVPTAKPERPISPLLRPATRMRMPRQGSGRQRETFVTQATAPAPASTPSPAKSEDTTQQASTETPVAQVESPAPALETIEDKKADVVAEEVKVEQSEPPKPARRYRFDRPAPATQPVISSKPISLAPSPAEPVGVRPRPENIATEQVSKATNGSAVEAPASSTKTESEPVSTPESEVTAPTAPAGRPNNDRRRRHGQEGQRSKAQTTIDAVKDIAKADGVNADATKTEALNRVPTGTPPVEQAAPSAQTETPLEAINQPSTDIPVEDLPPLEYSELQAASRRRRRRRTNGNGTTPTSVARLTPQPAVSAPAPAIPSPIAPVAPVTPARNAEVINRAPAVTPNVPSTPFTIQSGMTVNQMNQGNDAAGPFQGPEPTPARGSVLPAQPRMARPMRNGNEAQRGSVTPLPAVRNGDGIISTGAVNHLANVISQAIQLQSDRMVAELRRANQTPASVSVTLPPFPSTERVGVFVDVANLLYSARTLRMTIDFGKLLDFLRGNRRLVRAHAYCPTSPQPGDDQMFLQAVKGLGYRITTKNYKTFASGAKKADMDLDLCMDVVRLVDGGAVDCIVLVSGDGDFIPMLDYCSDHGVRVEVVAFDESMSATLRQSCDLFINLSMLDEIRA